MKYAIVRMGGKQLKVQEGETFKIERQKAVDLDVLAYSDEKEVLIGTPVLDSISVEAVIEGEEKGEKIEVSRFRAKSRHRRKKGHRQPLSVVKIQKISKKGAKRGT